MSETTVPDKTTRTVEIDSHAINFGPQHPAAHGVLRLILEMDGEIVAPRRSAYRPAASRHREADRIQDLHAGGAVFRPARLRLADVRGARLRPGDREAAGHRRCRSAAQWIRTLFAEITRVLNHLLNVTTYALDVGAITPSLWGFEEREKLMEFHEAASGARLHANYFRPGGVSKDLPAGPGGQDRRLGRDVSEIHRRPGNAADRQPHLEAAHRRYRPDERRGGAGLGLHRSLHPRKRRAVGSAARAALRQIRRGAISRCRSAATATATTAT